MTMLTLPGISIRLIQQLVAARYKVPVEMMRSPVRPREFAWPRQMAMALASEFTDKSRGTVGRQFGGHHSSTVLHAARAIERRAFIDESTRHHSAFLRAKLDQISSKPVEEMHRGTSLI